MDCQGVWFVKGKDYRENRKRRKHEKGQKGEENRKGQRGETNKEIRKREKMNHESTKERNREKEKGGRERKKRKDLEDFFRERGDSIGWRSRPCISFDIFDCWVRALRPFGSGRRPGPVAPA